MKNKLAINLFSSGLQAISLQLLGGLFFYFISVYISKSDFGIINWTNSVSIFITILIGFGMEQVVVRRIAASKRSDWTAVVFFIHSLIGFLIVFFLLLFVSSIPGNHLGIYKALPWFFLAQGLTFIGIPLKQFLNAKEKFTPYGIIALVSNISRILLAWIFVSKGILSILTVLLIMTGAAAFELIGLLGYILIKEKLTIRLRFSAYVKLLKESSAQYVSVIFDMSLSRMDWILLGIMTSNVTLADYSIAYRSYELARLPLFIIAPMILPKFSRLLALNQKLGADQQQAVAYFNQTEMFAAVLIALVLNILWVPAVGYITHGKYGESNALEFMILSCCIPLQFMINLFWTLGFSARKYKKTSVVIISCAVINMALNLLLIPFFKGTGAAAVFLITNVVMIALYYRVIRKEIIKVSFTPLCFFAILGITIYVLTGLLLVNFIVRLVAAVIIYIAAAIVFKQISRQHIVNLKALLTK